MNELDKLRRAQGYMEQLAQGIDPISGVELPEDTVLNQPRLIRCFFYVAGVLREDGDLMERGQRGPRPKKGPFRMTREERDAVPIGAEPATISEFAAAVNAAAGGGVTCAKLPTTAFTGYLVEKGFLREVETAPGKRRKEPTAQGVALGITPVEREGQYGVYLSVQYSAGARRFLLDNLEDVVAWREAQRA